MNLKEHFLRLLIKYATPLKWSLGLLIIDLSTSKFVEQHGSLIFDSQFAKTTLCCILFILLVFIIFRLLKPRGEQDIQALLILLFMPSFFLLDGLTKHSIILLVLACRWHKVSRIACSALSILAAIAIAWYGIPQSFFYDYYTPDNKILCSKDGIYHLYKYPWRNSHETTYVLFRKVQLLPGISLTKKIADYTSAKPVTVIPAADGSYKIVNVQPKDSKLSSD